MLLLLISFICKVFNIINYKEGGGNMIRLKTNLINLVQNVTEMLLELGEMGLNNYWLT